MDILIAVLFWSFVIFLILIALPLPRLTDWLNCAARAVGYVLFFLGVRWR